jgi:glutaredoxin 3
MSDNSKVLMYSTPFCPYCIRAKSLLNRKGVEFEEIDVGGNMSLWQEMEEKSGRNTVPQIYIGDYHVGGYDDMAALEHTGKLNELLGVTQ